MSPTRINLHPSDRESPESGRTHPLLSRAARVVPSAARPRGFTVLEVSIAVSLFLVIASVLTLALARSTAVNVSERLSRQLDARASSLLEQVAESPYERLLNGTFEVPPGDVTASGEAPVGCENLDLDDSLPNSEPNPQLASCLVVGTRAYAVRYSVTTESVGGEAAGATTALVTATVTPADGVRRPDDPILTDEGALVLTRKVSPPVAGLRTSNEGLVRVTVRDTRKITTGQLPIYLFTLPSATAPSERVAAATIPERTPSAAAQETGQRSQETSAVLLRDPSNICATRRCAVGLRVPTPADPGYAEAGEIGLSLDTARDDAGFIVPRGVPERPVAAAVEQTVSVFDRGSARIALVAQSDDGRTGSPPQDAQTDTRGSVCIWVSFKDGAATRSVPACNFSAAGSVILDRYYPSVTSISPFPFPVGVPLKVSVDSPGGNCPVIPNRTAPEDRGEGEPGRVQGSVRRSLTFPGGWRDAAVCTGYTWGVPSELRVFSDPSVPPASTPLVLEQGTQVQAELVWKCEPGIPCAARPAVGVNGGPLWSKPRGATPCSEPNTSASCTSPGPSYNPEETECPATQFHCRSVATAAPSLRRPSPLAVEYDPGSPVSFPLEVVDSDAGERFTVTVIRTPASGTVSCTGGGTSTVATASQPAVLTGTCTYSGAGPRLQVFGLRLTDSAGLSRDVEIPFVERGTVEPFQVLAGSARVVQGETVRVSVTVIGTDGKLFNGAPVAFSAPAATRLSFDPATSTTESTGVASSELSAPADAPHGAATGLQARLANGQGASFSATVVQRVDQVSLEATGGPQGGTGTFQARALDRAGVPVAGREIGVVVLAQGAPSELVYPEFAGCLTDVDGRCDTQRIIIDARATAGAYELRATGVTSPGAAFTVAQVPAVARVAEAAQIPQGETAPVLLQILDGAGRPYVGSQLAVPQSSEEAALTPAVSSARIDSQGFLRDSNGVSTLIYTARADAPAQVWKPRVSVAGRELPFPVAITPVATTVSIILPTGQEAGSVAPQFKVVQNSSTSMVVVVRDGAGKKMSGAYVSFLLSNTQLDPQGQPLPVPPSVRIGAAASTNSLGQAVTPISASADAPAGATYDITVKLAVGSGEEKKATLLVEAGSGGA